MTEIESALNVAAWAPSAKNQHPTKYYVVNDKETIDAMMTLIVEHIKETGDCPEVLDGLSNDWNKVFGKAQTVIIAYARNNDNRADLRGDGTAGKGNRYLLVRLSAEIFESLRETGGDVPDSGE